ncbi:hypothetical protein Tco_0807800 [Tanacetum coccineum]
MSIDNLYNNFKIVKQSVKKSAGAISGAQNSAFMTAPSTSSTNDANTAKPAYEVSTVGPNVNTASHKSELIEAVEWRALDNDEVQQRSEARSLVAGCMVPRRCFLRRAARTAVEFVLEQESERMWKLTMVIAISTEAARSAARRLQVSRDRSDKSRIEQARAACHNLGQCQLLEQSLGKTQSRTPHSYSRRSTIRSRRLLDNDICGLEFYVPPHIIDCVCTDYRVCAEFACQRFINPTIFKQCTLRSSGIQYGKREWSSQQPGDHT